MDSLKRQSQQEVRVLILSCLIAAVGNDCDALLVEIGIDQHIAIDRCIQGRISFTNLDSTELDGGLRLKL